MQKKKILFAIVTALSLAVLFFSALAPPSIVNPISVNTKTNQVDNAPIPDLITDEQFVNEYTAYIEEVRANANGDVETLQACDQIMAELQESITYVNGVLVLNGPDDAGSSTPAQRSKPGDPCEDLMKQYNAWNELFEQARTNCILNGVMKDCLKAMWYKHMMNKAYLKMYLLDCPLPEFAAIAEME